MMRRWSIRTRVLFLALLPTAIVVVVLGSVLSYYRAVEIEDSLQERGAAIARHLARSAEFGLFSGDRGALQRAAEDARAEPDVDSVEIFDSRSQLMAQSENRDRPPDAALRLRYVEPVLQAILQFSDVPDSAAPVPQRLGQVVVSMSALSTQAAKRNGWYLALAVGAGCLALAASVALSIGRGVSEPIRQQAEAIRAIAGGDLGARIDGTFGGELGALAAGINQMAAALQASQRDLEERIGRATQQLQLQKEAAEDANRAKSRFLAAASHDLRQPLHAIELFAEALRRKVRGRETRELSERLEQAIFSMDSLFNALLDVYQLDAGVLKPELRAFPVQELFNGIETEFRNDAAGRGLRLRLHPTTKVAWSDPILVHRILANLVSNALRYTPRGTVLVACRRHDAGLRIEVRDSGIGIEQGEQLNVFREFYRMEGGRRDGGMGLGLTIVTRIAALLHTQVGLRSEPGKGSVFSVTLPRRPDLSAPRAPERPQLRSLRATHLGVIIVDNDPLVLQGALALTRDWRISVATAVNIAQAHDALETVNQDAVLVLSDLWLSDGEDGLQLLEQLRAKDARRIFGVIITGDTRPETMQKIQAAGYPVLHKPVSAAKLRATFQYYVSKTSGKEQPT